MRRRPPSTFEPAALPIDAEPVRLKAPRRSAMGSVIGHTGFNVARYHTTHVFGALFPLLAGVLMFGWRAAAAVLIVISTTMVAGSIWRRIGLRGHPLRPTQLLWLGLVIALMLPANLLQLKGHNAPWPILPAAGLLIVILCWAFSGVGSGRFHPAVVVYLLLAMCYSPLLTPHAVLQRNRLLLGDVLNSPMHAEPRATQLPWMKRPIVLGQQAIHTVPAIQSLADFTRHGLSPNGTIVSMESLLRDQLPPMEDFVLGAVPGGMGVTSAVAVIIGGLFLLYRGLIDFRIPLLITMWAWLGMLILPLPFWIDDQQQWKWLPGHMQGVGWTMGVTLANYQVLASPLLFTAFFLAGSPSVRPLTRKGRAIYAIMIGLLAAGFQLYLSVPLGSYLALFLVGLATPLIDRFMASRSLV